MEFLKFLLKVLFMLATVALMVAPIAMEFYTFHKDKENKISYKRFRIVVFTVIYAVAVTVALYLLKEFILWLETLSFIQWLVNKIALSGRIVYYGKVLVAILVNFAIGFIFRFLSKFIRIGLKNKSLTEPKKKNGKFTWRQLLECKVIRFFHTETWFYVGTVLKYLSTALSAIYVVSFIFYHMPTTVL